MADKDEIRDQDDLPILADDTETDQETANDDADESDDGDDYDILAEMADDERHVLSMLTDEERAALEGDDDDDPEAEAEAERDEPGDDDPDQAAAAKGTEPDEDPDAENQAGQGESAQVELTQEDYDQIKADFKQQKADLRDKWRDGDLTDEEFDQQSDALDDSRETAVAEARAAKAAQARQAAREQEEQALIEEARSYFKEFPDLASKAHIMDLDRHVGIVTASSRYNNLSAREKLEKAHALYVAEGRVAGFDVPGAEKFGATDQKPAKEQQKAQQTQQAKPKPRRPEAPKTLANVPAAASNSAIDGKYGQLEHILMNGTVEEQMAALSKLPDDERERFASMDLGAE